MDLKSFTELTRNYNFIPVYEKITADLLTPVMVYLKLRAKNVQSFLLESVEGKESLGRYSFIGVNPEKIITNTGMDIQVSQNGNIINTRENIFTFLRKEIENRKSPELEDLPSFTGGLVGYIGYENISRIESVIKFKDESVYPDSILGLYNTIIAFDHYKHQIILITHVFTEDKKNNEEYFNEAKKLLNEIRCILTKPLNFKSDFKLNNNISVNISDEEFHKQVIASKNNILEGDIFQIVLSKRFSAQYSGDLFNVYRALRIINPSPYMYFLEYQDGLSIIGTSPENLVKVKNGIAEVLPIAGTRKRGKTKEDDLRLEEDLINDPKERAEHVMLLDLGRNDLGRVCEFNSVKVSQNMQIHRYSHVMHMVSKVEGKLKQDKDCVDALTACFPAGTVTGAPKIRAIQLINDYENINRNIYAGCVGYIDFCGNLDMCITIRTLFAKDNIVQWQAGAGIVADSIPALESKEINNKSAVLVNALQFAEIIDEDLSNR